MKPSIEIYSAGKNPADTISSTLDSVLAQTVMDWRFTYVDLGSTDNTIEIVKRYSERDPRISALIIPSPMRAESYNTAAGSSSAEYIAFIDPDDCWEPEFLFTLRTSLQKYPTAAVAFAACQAVDPAGNALEFPKNDPIPPAPSPISLNERLLFELNIILCPSAVLIRGSFFRRIPGWPKGFPYPFLADDYTLWMRLAKKGAFIPHSRKLVRYFVRPNSSSALISQGSKADLTRLLILNAILKEDLFPDELSKKSKLRWIESTIGFLGRIIQGSTPRDSNVATPDPINLLIKVVKRFPEKFTFRMIAISAKTALRRKFGAEKR